jgi:hypothetical protein
MLVESDSNARCLQAIELTIRFVLTCFVPLGFLLLGVCLLFEKGYKPGVNIGLAIVVLYFTVAYRHCGRGNRAALIVAGLAGLTAANAAAAVYSSNDAGDSSMDFNPATGLMMIGDFDTKGNLYGFGTISGGISGADASMFDDNISMFDDNHHRFNPVNGLPMVDDVTDIHGNMFGTNSVDEPFDYSSSIFDDSITYGSFDDSFNSGTIDDGWNK